MNYKASILPTAVLAALFASSAYAAQPLGKGQVVDTVVGKDAAVHSFITNDPLGDVVNVVETAKGLYVFDMPAFKADAEAWNRYLNGLGKPVLAQFVSNHAGVTKEGAASKVPSYATKAAANALAEGSSKALSDSLAGAFGPEFLNVLLKPAHELGLGRQDVAGLEVDVRADGDGYAVVLPAYKCAFRHMLGGDVHSIVGSKEHADNLIGQLEAYRSEGVKHVFTTHHAPEDASAVAAKIKYLEAVRAAASSEKTADGFIAKIQGAYPGFGGADYLKKTAGYLFPAGH